MKHKYKFTLIKNTWLFFVVFFVFMQLKGIGQREDSLFMYKVDDLLVASEQFRAPCPFNLDFVVAQKFNAIFCSLGIDHDSHVEHIMKIDLDNNAISYIELNLGNKFDFRTNFSKLFIMKEYPDLLFLNSNENMFVYDIVSGAVKTLGEFPYLQRFYYEEEFQISSFYYNDFRPSQRTYLIKTVNGKMAKKIAPPKGDIELTNFSPIRLTEFGERMIYWMSVSEPKIYVYDYELNLKSEYTFETNENWIDRSDAYMNPKYEKLDKDDVFSTVSTLLLDTLSKNNSIQFLNDSTLIVTSMHSMKREKSILLALDSNGFISGSRGDFKMEYNLNKMDEDHSFPHMGMSRGVWANGVLYLLQRGESDEDLPTKRKLTLSKFILNRS